MNLNFFMVVLNVFCSAQKQGGKFGKPLGSRLAFRVSLVIGTICL